MRGLRRSGLPGLVPACAIALSILGTSAHASADITKSQCVDANTYGQTLRREGKLTAARGQFQLCNDPKCPEIVRTDCTQRLDEIEAAFPGIVFDVKKADGNDVSEVKVSIDGKVVAEKIDGTPFRVDPGSHEFSFEIAGEKALIRTFVLKEGEKTRTERILFVGPEGPPKPAPAPGPAPPPPQPASGGPNGDVLRYAGLGVAAAGVVALGVGVFYGFKAKSKWDDQQDNCKSLTDCKNHPQAISDHDGAVVWGRFSTIGLITGAVLLAGGAALFLLAPRSESKTGMAKTLQRVRASSDSLSLSF